MAVILTLFEHETIAFAWQSRHVGILERLAAQSGGEVLRPTTHNGVPVLKASQFVGIVRLGDVTIQILPKIYRRNAPTEKRSEEATRNLLHLLAYAGTLQIRQAVIASLLQRRSDWFEILTSLFATHLTAEWQRGAARTYQTIEEELPVLKGSWRIAEQLRRPERRHLFAVTYDELTADNQLNRVLRFVVERLWRLTRDLDNRRLLGELRQWMEDVALVPAVTARQAGPELITRLNSRYEPLLNLARLFLDGGALQLTSGDLSNFAFVFDMNRLFEGFVAGFLARHRAEILPQALENCEILPQTRGAARWLAQVGGRDVFRLEPDLALRQGEAFPILIDTKYKQLNPDKATTLGVAQEDFYQMYAYATRYGCPRVILLYPQNFESAGVELPRFRFAHMPGQIDVAVIDIRRDLGAADVRADLIAHLRSILEGEST